MRIRSPNCSSWRRPLTPGREHRDLLAAPARDDVGGSQPLGQPAHDLDQHLVADCVAEAVVDRLEAVEVDDEQPRRHGSANDPCVLGGHRLLEGAPVRAPVSWSRRAFACSAASSAAVEARLRWAISSVARSEPSSSRRGRGSCPRPIRRTERSGTTSTALEEVDAQAAAARARAGARVRRSSMIRNRPALFTSDRDRHRPRPPLAIVSVPSPRGAPTRRCRRRAPGATATPPSAAWRRQTDSGRMICVEMPAATPRSGPPISAARTMTGVEAVYQLRGPSWTTTRSAAAAATTSATRSASDVSSAAPSMSHPERRRDDRDERDPDRDAGAAGRVGDARGGRSRVPGRPSPACRSWTRHLRSSNVSNVHADIPRSGEAGSESPVYRRLGGSSRRRRPRSGARA